MRSIPANPFCIRSGKTPNGRNTMNIITVNRPALTPEERARRMEEIKQAAARLVLETKKAKQTKSSKINS